ncbi:MAG: AAA family ATPase [Verrucomicrobia bacterium]|nr:AAA family ATPase [Verrucomicrobiota bacterium]
MPFLPDTNVWVRHLKQSGSEIERRLRSLRPSDVLLCSVVKAELWHGAQKYGRPDRRLAVLAKLFEPFASVPFDDDAARHYANIRHDLETRGDVIGPNDLIIAARSHPVSVLFLDDVDGLLPRRGGNSVVDNRLVVQFLAEVGGFADSPNILLLLGATNKPWDIDEAVFRTGRFDEKIFVGLPDAAARESMIRSNLANAPVAPDLDLTALAARLDGCTGSDIGAIIHSAKRAGFRRSLDGGSSRLAIADIESAFKTIPPSATAEMMQEYEKFAGARFRQH